ncbi:MAG TPA: gephyrin-like molybdotransferase Glp [Solirubrobacteraceae bacterium]|nr:gephyrin-like molybdotransferase Glp [Solirubrobacteraceae bacterium]
MIGERISIEDARRAVREEVRPVGSEPVGLVEALGRVLAEDASAPNDVPPFASSSMDGFALRAADTAQAPVSLPIIGEARAGAGSDVRVQAGTAIRISTGAPIPAGADAIIRQELTRVDDGVVVVEEAVGVGNDIRRAGEDIPAGTLILSAGTLLGPAEIGVLASVNIPRPAVARRPRIALVSTGDELVEPGRDLGPGEIRDSNVPTLTAAARAAGAEVISSRRVGDDREETVATLAAAVAGVDILITCGGVSVGPHDHVRPALARLGAREVFARVSLKPGGQVCFYVAADGTLVFALPGNPGSALTAFRVLVVPAVYAMLGRTLVQHTARGIAGVDLPGTIGRTTVVRCHAEMHDDGWHVTPNGAQGWHILTSMLGLPALALVPEDRDRLAAGEAVDIEFIA